MILSGRRSLRSELSERNELIKCGKKYLKKSRNLSPCQDSGAPKQKPAEGRMTSESAIKSGGEVGRTVGEGRRGEAGGRAWQRAAERGGAAVSQRGESASQQHSRTEQGEERGREPAGASQPAASQSQRGGARPAGQHGGPTSPTA